MFSFFSWLRSQAKAAVMSGVSDALAELHDGTDDTNPAVAALQARLAPALPAPSTDTPDASAPATNGRSRRKAEAA